MQTGAHRIHALARDAEDGDEFSRAGDADLVDEGLDGALAVDRVAVGDDLEELLAEAADGVLVGCLGLAWRG